MVMMAGTWTVVLQFVDKFCEAKEAAKKAVEERKLGGKKIEDSDKITSFSPELKSPHQVTLTSPSSTSPQVDGRKGEEGARKPSVGWITNGDSGAGRKTAYANSTEVKHIEWHQCTNNLVGVVVVCTVIPSCVPGSSGWGISRSPAGGPAL